MSESIRKLNENPVTALADTDYIVACDASGALRPILRSDFLKGIRIGGRNLIPGSAKFTGWSEKMMHIVVSEPEGIFTVVQPDRDWEGQFLPMSFTAGLPYTFSVLVDNPSLAQIYLKYVNNSLGTQSASFSNEKISVRQISAGWFQKSISAICTVSGISNLEFETQTANSVKFCAPKLEIGEIATDWSPAPEDIKSAWGGVITTHPITCAPQEKGVQHERDCESPYQRLSQRNHVGCDGSERSILQYRRVADTGDIYRGSRAINGNISNGRSLLEIRLTGSDAVKSTPYNPAHHLRKRGCCHKDMVGRPLVYLENAYLIIHRKEAVAA